MRSFKRAGTFALLAAGLVLASALPVSAGDQIKGAYSPFIIQNGETILEGIVDVRNLAGSPAFARMAVISTEPQTLLKVVGRSVTCSGQQRPRNKKWELSFLTGNDGSYFESKPVSVATGVIKSHWFSGPDGLIGCAAASMYEEMPPATAVRPQAVDDGIQDGNIGRLPESGAHRGSALVVRLDGGNAGITVSLKGLTDHHDYSIRGVSKACGQSFTSSQVTFSGQLTNASAADVVVLRKTLTLSQIAGLRSLRVKDIDTGTGWGCVPLTKFQIVTS